ncbi:uncharacterized protein LOC124198559 isoform X2 [Daphnia pulex]|uniref:uncharacterized protein LOC124198559 isoform X2 n=1 Tax=Daphnia pulex TaxID=6669 RepID=UPI001EDF79B9|nr:uncharacterized protein LOC124198559 isoform X2 [Daphnia pulex]
MAAIKHNGLSHQGSSSCSSNSSSNGSNNGSVMGDCHGTTDGGDSSSGFEWVGASCGQHGTYTLYKAVKLSSQSCHRRVLALGDFFFVKMWTDQEIVSIGELQLLWEDEKFPVHNNGHNHHHQPSSSSPLASLKLYFLPENTPDGRHEEHGEDEVVSISEKVVLKVSDLATWLVDDVKWEKGLPSVWERHCPTPPPSPPDSPDEADSTEAIPAAGSNIGVLDMRDVIKEKQAIGDASSSNVLVLSYPAYCRYRSTLKRLEGHNQTDYMRQAVVEAIGGRAAPSPNTRVVFCKDTFDYPELEDHELLCNHLAPKWKGRPKKMRSKKRSHSPGSESNESESSVSTVTSSSRSKDSPMKPGIRNVPAPYRAGDRPKGEQVFMQKLHKFMAGQGTPIGRLPSLGFKQLDLFLFYTKVQRAGGYEAAVANKQWKGIYIELGGHPSNTSAATCTRRHYEKLLLPYERHAMSLAAEESTMASTSVATPPKKRKISDVSDLPFEVPTEMKERLKAMTESSSLNLAGLMAAGDPANLLAAVAAAAATGDAKQLSALGDLARYAQQLDSSGSKMNRIKESKIHSGSSEVTKDGDIRRPSVIQKIVVDSPKANKGGQQPTGSSAQGAGLGPPPPAHSQKPITLPSIPAGEVPASEQLRQWYAQMLSDKATGGNPLPASAAAMLELTLRPPAPAAATPSIFVPSRRIYVDPNLDIKRNRTTTNNTLPAGSSSAIPAAHSKPAPAINNNKIPPAVNSGPPPLQNITPPRPAPPPPAPTQANHSLSRCSMPTSQQVPPARSSAIPLVDLTSRSINNMKQEDHHSSRKGQQPFPAHSSSHIEVNGKPLLDLSGHQQNKLPGLSKQWNNSPRSGDVSICLNVKIDGSGAEGKISSGAGSSSNSQRHSVSVVPLVKEETSSNSRHRKEKEMMRMDRVSVTPQQQQQQQQPQTQSYPRMVDSLVTMNASSSSGASSMTKSGPTMTSSHYGGSSSSSGASKPTTSSSSAGLHAGYPPLLDPALASYYSSLYSSHMYSLPVGAGAFMAAAAAAGPPQLHHPPTSSAMFHHHHHQQMMQSSAAAEVTAQAYKDMIQRGYPPALAPVLPPGLSGLPGLSSLGSYASMYSSMGGGKDPTPAERSLPKS